LRVTLVIFTQSNRDNIMAFGDFTVTRASTKNVLGDAGLYVSVANNVPAFEFNTDGTYRGLLVEPGATNSIRNNSNTGAVAGTPGTLPTNWAQNLRGLTRTIVGTGTFGGITYIDFQFAGTATETAGVQTLFESTTSIVASNGQTWTNSFWLQILAQPSPPINARVVMTERTDVGGGVVGGSATISTPTVWGRYSLTRTLSGGGTVARVTPEVQFDVTNGASYDFTVRIGWPQMELGSVATSPIVTTAGTASRVADVITLTSASSLIGQTANTLYVEGEIQTFTGASDACIFALTDGTSDDAIVIGTVAANGRIEAVVRDGGSDQATIASGSFTTGVFKCAIASAVNDVAFYLNGSSVGTDTSATHPALSVFQFGGTVAVVAPTARPVWFRAISDFPTRIANATLVTLTTL
jgi:hypothetical protein